MAPDKTGSDDYEWPTIRPESSHPLVTLRPELPASPEWRFSTDVRASADFTHSLATRIVVTLHGSSRAIEPSVVAPDIFRKRDTSE